MSGARVRYFPEAVWELEEAFERYLERSPRAAEAFLRETERAFALIAGSPRLWPRFDKGTRRYVLRKFPYSILYRDRENQVEVVAVAHHKRRPRYWYRRLRR